jgi:Flp pilus assembly protein TadD
MAGPSERVGETSPGRVAVRFSHLLALIQRSCFNSTCREHAVSYQNLLRTVLSLIVLVCCGSAASGQEAKSLNEQGVSAFQAKQYVEAIDHFSKALAEEPDNASVQRNLCAVHQAVAADLANQGDFKNALAEVLKGIEVAPENAAALGQAGSYALKLNDLEEALKHLTAARALTPNDTDLLVILGETHYKLKQLEEARAAWSAALELRPDWPELQARFDALSEEYALGSDFSTYTSGHFELRSAQALPEGLQATTFSLLEEAYQTVGANLGGVFPAGPVTVLLFGGDAIKDFMADPEHAVAPYRGRIRAGVADTRGRYLTPRALKARLTHEYVHLALEHAADGQPLPWWLVEGIAETFSRDMDQTRSRQLGRLARAEALRPLAELEANPLAILDPKTVPDAYAEAHAAAAHLWEQGGAEKLAALLKRLKGGESGEAALRSVYGLDYAGLLQAITSAYGANR